MSSSAPVPFLITAQQAPPPAQGILELFASYNTPFPGDAHVAPPLILTTVSTLQTLNVVSEIEDYFSNVLPNMQPNPYSPIALYDVTLTTGTAVDSSIYNFKTVSNNTGSDLIPGEQAKVMNAAISNMEGIYNTAALQFVMSLFNTHTANITTNPHDDTSFYNIWTDFFTILYDAYASTIAPQVTPANAITTYLTSLYPYPVAPKGFALQLGSYINLVGSAVIDYDTFITDKTVPFTLAHPTDFLTATGTADPAAAIADYFTTTFAAEWASVGSNNAVLIDYQWSPTTPANPSTTVVSVATLMEVFSWHKDGTDSTIHPTLQATLEPGIVIPHARFALDQAIQAELVAPGVALAFNNALPHCQGALLVTATMGAAVSQQALVTLSNTTTTDSLTIFQPAGTTNTYTVTLVVDGITYSHVLSAVAAPMGLIVSYSGTTVNLYYLNTSAVLQTVQYAATPLYCDFNQITLGVGLGTASGTLQQVIAYPAPFSATEATLFLTSLTP